MDDDGNRRRDVLLTVLAWGLVVAWLVVVVHDHPLGK